MDHQSSRTIHSPITVEPRPPLLAGEGQRAPVSADAHAVLELHREARISAATALGRDRWRSGGRGGSRAPRPFSLPWPAAQPLAHAVTSQLTPPQLQRFW